MFGGPFDAGGDRHGLFIFDMETVVDVLRLEGEKSMVKSGKLRIDTFLLVE